MNSPLLPADFADLEPYAAKWALPTEVQRYAQRLSSTMSELQDLYDVVFPRATAAMDHLDQYPLDEMPDDAQRLLQLLYSFILASFPVELYHQPQIPDTGSAELNFTIEPVP